MKNLVNERDIRHNISKSHVQGQTRRVLDLFYFIYYFYLTETMLIK